MKLIVGLGNPGPNTRRPGTTSARWSSTSWSPRRVSGGRCTKSGAQVATARLAGEPVLIARPTTYMNTSGQQVGPLAKVLFRGARRSDRRTTSSISTSVSSGSNAVAVKADTTACGRSARCSALRDYLRVRLGIGRPPGRQDPADFVIKPFPAAAKADVGLLIGNGAEAAGSWSGRA